MEKVSDRYKHTLDLARYKAFTALALLADGNERALEEIDEAIHFFEWLGLEEVNEEIIELRDSLLKKLYIKMIRLFINSHSSSFYFCCNTIQKITFR